MKKILFIMMAMAMVTACTKEGTPQHDQKVKQIYSSKTVSLTGTGAEVYQLNRQLVEEWQWEGKEVYRIDYQEDQSTYNENFFYNFRHQIVRSTVPAYDLTSELEYDGRWLKKITVKFKGEDYYTLEFTHTDKHISDIEANMVGGEEPENVALQTTKLVRFAIGKDMTAKLAERLAAKGGAKASFHFTLTWEDDDLVEIRQGENRIQYTYSEQKNPFRQLYSLYALDNEVGNMDLTLMSEHLLKKKVETSGEETKVTTYSYEGGDYPTRCKLTQTYEMLGGDNQITSYTATETRELVYE